MGGRGSSMASSQSGKSRVKTSAKSGAAYKPLNNQQLKNVSDSMLKKHLTKLTKEYYKSGKSGLSFGGRNTDDVVESLMKGKRSRASMLKDYKSIKKKMGYK
ncbi:MAG: hypothetical protein ACI4RN_07100 [Oscillospiraceae bacterium]